MRPRFSSRSRLVKLRAALLVAAVSFLVTLGLTFSGVLASYSLKTLDLLFRNVTLPPANPKVVLVAIDQNDLNFFKAQGVNWPWPRQLYAHIIDFCQRGGARAVIFDMIYSEPSVYGPEDDQRFAEAAAKAGNTVFPFVLSSEEEANPQEAEIIKKASLSMGGQAPPGMPAYRSLASPIPSLVTAAGMLGNAEAGSDDDGIYRHLPLVQPYKGRWLPFLAFAAYQRFEAQGPWRFAEGDLVRGGYRIPLDHQGRLLLKFRGPSRSHKRFNASNLIRSTHQLDKGLKPDHQPAEVAGAWVFVGVMPHGLRDLKPSPVAPRYTGVELQMTLLDNLLTGDFLRPLPKALLLGFTLLLTVAVSLGVFLSPGLAVTLGVLLLLGALNGGLAVLAFRLSWWADPVVPGLGLVLTFALATAVSYATEGRQKLAIRRMFSQYMSEAVINDLTEHPEKLKLGGERRRVTLFFSDLAGFTSLSESLPPEDVVNLLNDYLSRMTDIIMAEGGTVDKFEGDAIMAFWGAPLDQPDHAVRACRAALRQVAALAEVNQTLVAKNLPALSMRIGLHTGEAVVGNLGSEKRFDYTVIGDTVNLASRLEGLNKFYGNTIMASEVTRADCGDALEFLELDQVAVKGRETPVAVFAVLALKGGLTQAQLDAREEFGKGLHLYRQTRFPEAAGHFTQALKHLPALKPAQTFMERCQEFVANPPPPGWDAVFRPDKK
jgi:adenylate cyclase